MTLEEYAEKHGKEYEPQADNTDDGPRAYARAQAAQAERTKVVNGIKAAILEHLEQCAPAQSVLRLAINGVTVATNDSDFLQRCGMLINENYPEVDQCEIFHAVESKRQAAKAEEYAEKLRRQIRTQLKAIDKVSKNLRDALQSLNEPKQDEQPQAETGATATGQSTDSASLLRPYWTD